MRNLCLVSEEVLGVGDASLLGWCIDADNDVLYACGRSAGASATNIWRCNSSRSLHHLASVDDSTDHDILAPTSSPAIIALTFLAESRVICVIFRDGRLVTVQPDSGAVDIVGDVEGGVECAAWSPDESLLVVITARKNMLLMTQDFDVLSDAPVQTSDLGEEQAVNVGWGSKTTQFHGSVGKTAALRANDDAAAASRGGISPDDDQTPRVSWRGDGAFYVVSVVDQQSDGRPRRVLRVYSQQGALQTTSEPVPGLEHGLAWRPSGSLIASTQRFGFPGGGSGNSDRHDVVFFERNGLRHGEFQLREVARPQAPGTQAPTWDYRVNELSWSSDSSIIAVWISRSDCDVVQLWTTGNYHWYLKSEILSGAYGTGRYSRVAWHAEDPLRLIFVASGRLVTRRLAWETYASRSTHPFDTGMVAVVDGAALNLTPFRLQNFPPPMFSFSIQLPRRRPPVHASFASASDRLAAIWEDGHVTLWDLNTRPALERGVACSPSIAWESSLPAIATWRQVFIKPAEGDDLVVICALGRSTETGLDVVLRQQAHKEASSAQQFQLASAGGKLVDVDSPPLFWQSPDGEVCEVDQENDIATPAFSLPAFCGTVRQLRLDATFSAFVALSTSGLLTLANDGHTKQLATNCNSFTTTPGFLIYTTTSHEAVFESLGRLRAILSTDTHATDPSEVLRAETRRVERGSRIVTVVPSAMSLVLQMPRGNLETVYPRPLVLEVIRRDIDAENYRSAFVACRKHRIDLNIIVDHDRDAFLRNIPRFVDQVSDVDYLNLLLAGLGRSTSAQSFEQTAEACDAIRGELERRDLVRFVNAILTAHVVKTPPALEAALAVLLKLRESHPEVVEDAARYVIFLVDADKLFDTALGMYDFSLVLLIAQFSQKDPREYLPFLRELRSLPTAYQRFRIDEHLKRYESALRNLSRAGNERFGEALRFVERHRLFALACGLWEKGTDEWKAVVELYGDDLFDRRDFEQAAIAFVSCSRLPKALVAYEHALLWRELFALAATMQKTAEEILDMGRRVADELLSKRRHLDAAAVYQIYAQDVEGAVRALVDGNEYAEALRVVAINTSSSDLLTTLILPTSLDTQASILESLDEQREQLRKQLSRLTELATRKLEEPDAFYGDEPAGLHGVDVMTDASAFTAFTRYTKAGTSTAGSAYSRKSKRKSERKANSGRKGTVDEEKYLLTSIVKLATARIVATRAEAAKLLPHLVAFGINSPDHAAAARELQTELRNYEKELASAIEDVWKDERVVPDEKGAQVKVERPVLEKSNWRILVLDAPEYVADAAQ